MVEQNKLNLLILFLSLVIEHNPIQIYSFTVNELLSTQIVLGF
jgi:hypothetical protein